MDEMMSSMKNLYNIPNGTKINGKWHQNQYVIQRKLGQGAIGVVYLANWNGKDVAIKLSENNVTVTAEVNVLKSLSKAQGVTLGPSLLDVDDWMVGNDIVSFYVMEYINGADLLSFIRQKGKTWVEILILQLLSDLDSLHKEGWVFGDLKPENLIIAGQPTRIRIIDVGGTTRIGRSIKEFTEFFDRGYWGLGSRRAEPSYDLFAVAMIIINAYYPQRFTKTSQSDPFVQLKSAINQHQELKRFEAILLKALTGKYQQASQMRKDLAFSIQASVHAKKPRPTSTSTKPINQSRTSSRKIHTNSGMKTNRSSLVETLILLFIISSLYGLYIANQIGIEILEMFNFSSN